MPQIVALAWDDVVSEPGGLTPRDGRWREDGPRLPLELSRLSPQRFPVISLCRGGPLQRVYWTYLETEIVSEAVWNLSRRGACKPENIGFLDLESGECWCRAVDEHLEDIRAWALEKNREGENIEVVVWNDLKPDFEKKTRRELTPENVVSYLKGLRPEIRERARRYLENIPPRIETPILSAVRDAWSDIFDSPD